MTRMILAKGIGAALAFAVMAGFVGQASAGLREYCDSYARDVAHRKTNGGADAPAGDQGAGGVLGAGVGSDRYKRAYANAFQRCLNNYEGTAQTADQPTDQKVTAQKAVASEATDTKAASTSDATDETPAASEVTDETPAASEVTDKKAVKKVAAGKATEKKVAANEAVNKDEACARKYRSYDPQTGKYKSNSGKLRPCRL